MSVNIKGFLGVARDADANAQTHKSRANFYNKVASGLRNVAFAHMPVRIIAVKK